MRDWGKKIIIYIWFLVYFIYYIILNKYFQININGIMILLISKLLEIF